MWVQWRPGEGVHLLQHDDCSLPEQAVGAADRPYRYPRRSARGGVRKAVGQAVGGDLGCYQGEGGGGASGGGGAVQAAAGVVERAQIMANLPSGTVTFLF